VSLDWQKAVTYELKRIYNSDNGKMYLQFWHGYG